MGNLFLFANDVKGTNCWDGILFSETFLLLSRKMNALPETEIESVMEAMLIDELSNPV